MAVGSRQSPPAPECSMGCRIDTRSMLRCFGAETGARDAASCSKALSRSMLRCFGAETVRHCRDRCSVALERRPCRYVTWRQRSMLHYFLSGDAKDWTSGELWKKRVAIDADPQPWLLRVDVPQRSMLRCFGAETPSSPVTPSLTAKWITIDAPLLLGGDNGWAIAIDAPLLLVSGDVHAAAPMRASLTSRSMLRRFWGGDFTRRDRCSVVFETENGYGRMAK